MDIPIEVFGQRLRMPSNQKIFVSGSSDFVRFIFELSSDWSGMTVFARFQQGANRCDEFLDSNNSVCLPSTINAGDCKIALCGEKNGIIATTDYLTLKIKGNILLVESHMPTITYGTGNPSGGQNGDIYFKIKG